MTRTARMLAYVLIVLASTYLASAFIIVSRCDRAHSTAAAAAPSGSVDPSTA